MLTADDCTRCGACCCNPAENEAENWPWYVEIDDPRSALLKKPALRRYVAYDPDGAPHLRLDPSGRCAALTGRLGAAVRCQVYPHRPRGCRQVEPGSRACRQARAEKGLEAR